MSGIIAHGKFGCIGISLSPQTLAAIVAANQPGTATSSECTQSVLVSPFPAPERSCAPSAPTTGSNTGNVRSDLNAALARDGAFTLFQQKGPSAVAEYLNALFVVCEQDDSLRADFTAAATLAFQFLTPRLRNNATRPTEQLYHELTGRKVSRRLAKLAVRLTPGDRIGCDAGYNFNIVKAQPRPC